MNQEGCFITYFDLANEVKEMARGYDFTVSSVEKFKKSGRPCHVWIVDEGDPATTVDEIAGEYNANKSFYDNLKDNEIQTLQDNRYHEKD